MMKSRGESDWHDMAARWLNEPFMTKPIRPDLAVAAATIRGLAIIPLMSGRWLPATAQQVYYSQVEGTSHQMVTGLGLELVDDKASSHPARRQLFDSLGVKKLYVNTARAAVFSKHRAFATVGASRHLPIGEGVDELVFLYNTHHLVQETSAIMYNQYKDVRLVPDPAISDQVWAPTRDDFYIEADVPFSKKDCRRRLQLQNRTRGREPPMLQSRGFAPLLECFVLHEDYLRSTPAPPHPSTPPFKQWLYQFIKVRQHPRLFADAGLTDVGRYIVENHPEKFAHFLKTAGDLNMLSGVTRKEVKEAMVPCGGRRDTLCPLAKTYLPITSLKEFCSRFLRDDEFFPWLPDEPKVDYATFPKSWEAVGKACGLGFRGCDTEFMLDVLRHLSYANPTGERLCGPDGVFDLYVQVQAELRRSNQTRHATVVRYVFPEASLPQDSSG